MKKLRMGIIGVGGIATYRHVPAYKKLTDKVNITAICEVNEQLAKEKATAYAIPNAFQDYRDMFDHVHGRPIFQMMWKASAFLVI